jgi:hypothetical protein
MSSNPPGRGRSRGGRGGSAGYRGGGGGRRGGGRSQYSGLNPARQRSSRNYEERSPSFVGSQSSRNEGPGSAIRDEVGC